MEKAVGRIGIINSDLFSYQYFFQWYYYIPWVPECLSPPWNQRGEGNTCLRVKGRGEPIPQSTHRVATAAFWRTFNNDGKISPRWWRWGVHADPLSLYLPSRTKLQCTLQLRGKINSPYFISPVYSAANSDDWRESRALCILCGSATFSPVNCLLGDKAACLSTFFVRY